MAGIAEVKRKIGSKVTEEQIKLVFDAVLDLVKSEGNVVIKNFGTFKKVHKEEYMGVNPQDPSKKIKIAAKDHLKFKASPSVQLTVTEVKASPAARRR